MVLIFIPGVFINFTCQEKKNNQILLYDHIFIKLNHFSYLSLHLFISHLYLESKGVNRGAGSFWSAGGQKLAVSSETEKSRGPQLQLTAPSLEGLPV